MQKNILIIGAPRCGKTSLSRKIAKELGYSVISLDDIVSGFGAYKEIGIGHDLDDYEVSKKFTKFLKIYLKELSENSNFYSGIKVVIEGTHVDLDELLPFDNIENYEIIGLTYNNLTKDDIYNNIKKYDTEDEWTYYLSDEELYGNMNFFLERNKFFNDMFKRNNIKCYDTGENREKTFEEIIKDLSENNV